MSKKRGNKKNQDLDEDFEENKSVASNDTHEITSKVKGKGKKKGKGKYGDQSDDEPAKGDHQKKAPGSDDEDTPRPATKKSQKKGEF